MATGSTGPSSSSPSRSSRPRPLDQSPALLRTTRSPRWPGTAPRGSARITPAGDRPAGPGRFPKTSARPWCAAPGTGMPRLRRARRRTIMRIAPLRSPGRTEPGDRRHPWLDEIGHLDSGRWVGGDKYGRLTAIARPTVRSAPLSGGQDKYFARAQQAVGLAGRFEPEFQLPLNHEDQIDPVRGEPVLVDGLGQLAHPDHFDALPGEHGPDIAERRGPDLTGLAERHAENFRGRAARILDRRDRSQGSRRELVTLVPAAQDQRPQNRLAAALT